MELGSEQAYLGLTSCVTVNMAPSRMQSPPTTMYAMPRNGFLPPMTVWVDRSSDLVPSYGNTGKSTTKKR